MNTDHEQLERLLGDELRDRAGDMSGRRLPFADVRRRATSIRRRRRVAAGVAAAVVVALAVPAGLGIAGRTSSLTPIAPTPAPTPQPDGSFRLSIKGLPQGEPAKIGYTRIDREQLVMPAGVFDTPEAYLQISPYGTDGWLALRGGDFPPYGYRVAQLTEDFEVVREAPAGPGMIVNGDASTVAWVETDGDQSTLVVQPTDGSEPTREDIGPGRVSPVGFLTDDRILVSLTDQASEEETSVVVDQRGGGSVVQTVGFLHVTDASDATGYIAGQTDYRADGTSCSGVQLDDRMLWESCDYTLGQFSPSGRYVVGLASQSDGPGSPTLSILDARTGDPVVDFRPEKNVPLGVDQVDWEDADTVLATVTQGAEQALLRADLDGGLELVDGPIRSEGMEVEFWLAEHPFR